jgi:hypothetical protein
MLLEIVEIQDPEGARHGKARASSTRRTPTASIDSTRRPCHPKRTKQKSRRVLAAFLFGDQLI